MTLFTSSATGSLRGGNEASEIIEVLFVSPQEAGRLCATRRSSFDAKAWLVLSRFAATGKIDAFSAGPASALRFVGL